MTNTHVATEPDGITSQRAVDVARAGVGGDRSPTTPISLASYRVIFELAPEAIVLSDAKGRYVDANARALALLGYDREEFLRLGIRDTSALGPSWAIAER